MTPMYRVNVLPIKCCNRSGRGNEAVVYGLEAGGVGRSHCLAKATLSWDPGGVQGHNGVIVLASSRHRSRREIADDDRTTSSVGFDTCWSLLPKLSMQHSLIARLTGCAQSSLSPGMAVSVCQRLQIHHFVTSPHRSSPSLSLCQEQPKRRSCTAYLARHIFLHLCCTSDIQGGHLTYPALVRVASRRAGR